MKSVRSNVYTSNSNKKHIAKRNLAIYLKNNRLLSNNMYNILLLDFKHRHEINIQNKFVEQQACCMYDNTHNSLHISEYKLIKLKSGKARQQGSKYVKGFPVFKNNVDLNACRYLHVSKHDRHVNAEKYRENFNKLNDIIQACKDTGMTDYEIKKCIEADFNKKFPLMEHKLKHALKQFLTKDVNVIVSEAIGKTVATKVQEELKQIK